MARELTREESREFDRRLAQLREFLDLVEERELFTGETLEAVLEGVGNSMVRIEEQRDVEGLLGLREASRDLRGFLREVPEDVALEFARRAKERAGLDLEEDRAQERDIVEMVVARGTIENDFEYRLIRDSLEDMLLDDERDARLEKTLDALLAAYPR